MRTRAMKNPRHPIQWIEKGIKLDDYDKRVCVKVVEEIVKDKLIEFMRDEDELFDALFKKIHHAGSYYDRTRIGDPKEFDLNLMLDLGSEIIQCLHFQTGKGFVRMKLNTDPDDIQIPENHKFYPIKNKIFSTFFDDSRYLNEEKLKRWTQSILSRIQQRLSDECSFHGINKITVIHDAGPSKNLQIEHSEMGNINVDLVPVFYFPHQYLTGKQNIKQEITRYNIRNGCSRFPEGNKDLNVFMAVPKTPVNQSWWKDHSRDHTRYWRLCFHPWERLVINQGRRTECVRPVIRLLKNFRDCHKDKLIRISSYALKSVVMNIILERPSKIWDRCNIQEHFLEALEKLKFYMEKGSIPYIFDRTCNLLWSMQEENKRIAAEFLKGSVPELRESIGTVGCFDTWMEKFGYSTEEDSDYDSDDDDECSEDSYDQDYYNADGETYYNMSNLTSKFETIKLS